MSPQFLTEEPVAFVLDSDPVFLLGIRGVARARGVRVEACSPGEEFFQACDPTQSGCVFLDPQLTVSGGNVLLSRITEHFVHFPVVVVSSCGDVSAVVAAMRAGAINYLQKPCGEHQLAEALDEALRFSADNRQGALDRIRSQRRLGRLTPGEKQVLDLLLCGRSNKEIAQQLELSVRAIEARRKKVMEKMRAKSLADLLGQAIGSRS